MVISTVFKFYLKMNKNKISRQFLKTFINDEGEEIPYGERYAKLAESKKFWDDDLHWCIFPFQPPIRSNQLNGIQVGKFQKL